MEIQIINEGNFRTAVEQSAKPVLVDFYADWCHPCHMIHTELEQLAAEHGELTVGQVNVDENNNLAERFGINSIPCLILFRDGEPIKNVVGFRTKQQLEKIITED